MNIALACDHAGFQLKEELKSYLQSNGYEIDDVGCYNDESVDYPDYGRKAARLVADGKSNRAILVCGSGIGMSMVANKVGGIRAANCHTVQCAVLSRQHNDSNALCLGSRIINTEQAKEIVEAWLKTSFEGGRHIRRVKKIDG